MCVDIEPRPTLKRGQYFENQNHSGGGWGYGFAYWRFSISTSTRSLKSQQVAGWLFSTYMSYGYRLS